MIEGLLSIGTFVMDLFRSHREQDQEKREHISKLLDQISELLEHLHTDLEMGDYPHGTCAQMELLAQNLHQVLKEHLDDEYLAIMVNNLNSAVELEKMYAYKDDPAYLHKIRLASGYFKAAAALAMV